MKRNNQKQMGKRKLLVQLLDQDISFSADSLTFNSSSSWITDSLKYKSAGHLISITYCVRTMRAIPMRTSWLAQATWCAISQNRSTWTGYKVLHLRRSEHQGKGHGDRNSIYIAGLHGLSPYHKHLFLHVFPANIARQAPESCQDPNETTFASYASWYFELEF